MTLILALTGIYASGYITMALGRIVLERTARAM